MLSIQPGRWNILSGTIGVRRSLHGVGAQSRRESMTARRSLREGPSCPDIAATAWMVQSAALMTVSPAPLMT